MSISKTVTTMLRHFDQDERESDGSRHWDSIKSVLETKFAREGARDFSDEACFQRFLKAVQRRESNTARQRWIFVLFTSYSRTLWWYSNRAKN